MGRRKIGRRGERKARCQAHGFLPLWLPSSTGGSQGSAKVRSPAEVVVTGLEVTTCLAGGCENGHQNSTSVPLEKIICYRSDYFIEQQPSPCLSGGGEGGGGGGGGLLTVVSCEVEGKRRAWPSLNTLVSRPLQVFRSPYMAIIQLYSKLNSSKGGEKHKQKNGNRMGKVWLSVL